MSKVLVTGGTGAVGSHLIPALIKSGYEVNVVGRASTANLPVGTNYFKWDLVKHTMPTESLEGVVHIIHLAGAGIADHRWTDERKRIILDSRTIPLLLIRKTLRELGKTVSTVVSASGIGYYGAKTSDMVFIEDAEPASDFLGTTCIAWEDAVSYVADGADREVRLRTGVVLMQEGGALPKLVAPAKFGMGAPLGTGDQWMPWIHIDDLVALYIKAIESEQMSGSYNAVAPDQLRNRDFVRLINSILNRPNLAPKVPAIALKALLGEMAKLLTEGSRVSAKKLLDTGFRFKYPEARPALVNLLS